MAGYKGHTFGGFVFGILYVVGLLLLPGTVLLKTGGLLSSWQFVAGLLIVSSLFALWPDIDTNSKGQDLFFGIAFITDILLISFGYLEAAAYLGLLAMTPIIGKHRGWTHSRVAVIIVPIPIVAVTYLYKPEIIVTALLIYGAAVVGYFSHLLLDGKITRYVRFKT